MVLFSSFAAARGCSSPSLACVPQRMALALRDGSAKYIPGSKLLVVPYGPTIFSVRWRCNLNLIPGARGHENSSGFCFVFRKDGQRT